jgi:hypothetical protein
VRFRTAPFILAARTFRIVDHSTGNTRDVVLGDFEEVYHRGITIGGFAHCQRRRSGNAARHIAAWQTPALALTKTTTLGATPFGFYRPGGNSGPRIDEPFDAILVLAPVSSITIRRGEVSTSLCADDAYMKMWFIRMAVIDLPTADSRPVQSPADRLRQYCDNVMQRNQPEKK